MSLSSTFNYQGIHLTGSLPFKSAEETFQFIGKNLQAWTPRVPDGETGERVNWVLTQTPHFFENPSFDLVAPTEETPRQLVKIKAGVNPESITFPSFSYPDYASHSFPHFQRAKAEGVLPENAKFLISIPTPFNAVSFFAVLEDQAAILKAYEVQTKAATEEILSRFPHNEISIQWDLPTELATIQGWFPNPLGSDEAVYETVKTVSSWIPDEVDLGYHLCYGDSKFGASPFMGKPHECRFHRKDKGRNIVPENISTVVRVANALSEKIQRPINFIQTATMREWDEAKHWEALSELKLRPETQFYLGLVHASDAVDGALERLAFVNPHLSAYGISTECGLGRHSAEQLDSVTNTFRELSEQLSKGNQQLLEASVTA